MAAGKVANSGATRFLGETGSWMGWRRLPLVLSELFQEPVEGSLPFFFGVVSALGYLTANAVHQFLPYRGIRFLASRIVVLPGPACLLDLQVVGQSLGPILAFP